MVRHLKRFKNVLCSQEEDTEGLKRVLQETDVAQTEMVQKILTEVRMLSKIILASYLYGGGPEIILCHYL